MFHAFLAATVPVYVGPNTLRRVVPRRSVIFASDFSSAAALAEHLLYLSRNESAYGEWLAWRAAPLPPPLRAAMRLARWHVDNEDGSRCVVCGLLHEASSGLERVVHHLHKKHRWAGRPLTRPMKAITGL